MTPDDLLKKLQALGVNMSRSTLLRYEKAGLMPEPKRGADGRGLGRYTEYNNDASNYLYAAYMLIKKNKLTMDEVKEAQNIGEKIVCFGVDGLVSLQQVHGKVVLPNGDTIISDEDFYNKPELEQRRITRKEVLPKLPVSSRYWVMYYSVAQQKLDGFLLRETEYIIDTVNISSFKLRNMLEETLTDEWIRLKAITQELEALVIEHREDMKEIRAWLVLLKSFPDLAPLIKVNIINKFKYLSDDTIEWILKAL